MHVWKQRTRAMTPHGAFIQTGFATEVDAINMLVTDASELNPMDERGAGGKMKRGGKMKMSECHCECRDWKVDFRSLVLTLFTLIDLMLVHYSKRYCYSSSGFLRVHIATNYIFGLHSDKSMRGLLKEG